MATSLILFFHNKNKKSLGFALPSGFFIAISERTAKWDKINT
jgi:hypothetical protein